MTLDFSRMDTGRLTPVALDARFCKTLEFLAAQGRLLKAKSQSMTTFDVVAITGTASEGPSEVSALPVGAEFQRNEELP